MWETETDALFVVEGGRSAVPSILSAGALVEL